MYLQASIPFLLYFIQIVFIKFCKVSAGLTGQFAKDNTYQ